MALRHEKQRLPRLPIDQVNAHPNAYAGLKQAGAAARIGHTELITGEADSLTA